jgi:hypothetical protein
MDTRTEKRELTVQLTQEELNTKTARLLEVLEEMDAEEERLDSYRKHSKGRVAVLEAESEKLRRIVRAKEEVRNVECYWEFDYAAQLARLYREDTGELICDRPLKASEMQLDLNIPEDEPQPTEDEPGVAVAAICYDPDAFDEAELQPDVMVSDILCDACAAPLTEPGRCLECRAQAACLQYFEANWEPAKLQKCKPKDLVEAWAEYAAGGEFAQVRIPVVEIALHATGAVRRGNWVMIKQRLTTGE